MSCESLSPSKWDCKYHVVFITKCRKQALYGKTRKFLWLVFHELARQKMSQIEAGHMLISIPSKYAVSMVGFKEERVRHYLLAAAGAAGSEGLWRKEQ